MPPRRELNPVGSRALSHDSIFIPEDTEPCRDRSMSQENVSDKVRNLQVSLVSALAWLAEQLLVLGINVAVNWLLVINQFNHFFFKSEQKQIAQGIKFGQRPPSLRKSEGDEGSSDEEEVPRSPMKVLAQVEAEPADTEPKVKEQNWILNFKEEFSSVCYKRNIC